MYVNSVDHAIDAKQEPFFKDIKKCRRTSYESQWNDICIDILCYKYRIFEKEIHFGIVLTHITYIIRKIVRKV